MAIEVRRAAAAFAVFFILALAASAETPITEKNWMDHPRVKEVRAIYTEVEQAVKAGTLKRLAELPDGTVVWGGAARTVRRLDFETGGEDSAVRIGSWYDSAGTLRFVFVQAGAVNGTKLEYRVYFGADGQRFWENRRQTAGPGYPFPETVPDDWCIRDPGQLLRND